MLNKEVCKKCINKRAYGGWTNSDEEYWSRNLVSCPIIEQGIDRHMVRESIEEIPYWSCYKLGCFFKLEHVLKADENVK